MKNQFGRILLTTVIVVLGAFSLVHAQATRTWVSGVGDDANPCSRTAPCKTFAGAISKTAAGGEINVIDPGGFGAVTITKAITIDGGGTFASVLAAGTNGIVINAGTADVVTLRNLSMNGVGTGLNGIRFLAGKALHVENCAIFNFSQKGIDFEPGGDSQLFVLDTVVHNNAGASGGGIWIKPGASGAAEVVVERSRVERNFFGILAEDRTDVVIRDSVVASNVNNGLMAKSSGVAVTMNVENSAAVNNGTNGVRSSGAAATTRLSNATITGNARGILSDGGGVVLSFGNNKNTGNGVDGAPTGSIAQQ